MRLGDEEFTEDLDARHGAHLFGINEITVEGRHLLVAQNLLDPWIIAHRVIGSHADPGSVLDGLPERQAVIDHKTAGTRVLGIAPQIRQAMQPEDEGRLIPSQTDDGMMIEIVDALRLPEALDIGMGSISVVLDSEEAALDQIGLSRQA